jgi:hypothetical protein
MRRRRVLRGIAGDIDGAAIRRVGDLVRGLQALGCQVRLGDNTCTNIVDSTSSGMRSSPNGKPGIAAPSGREVPFERISGNGFLLTGGANNSPAAAVQIRERYKRKERTGRGPGGSTIVAKIILLSGAGDNAIADIGSDENRRSCGAVTVFDRAGTSTESGLPNHQDAEARRETGWTKAHGLSAAPSVTWAGHTTLPCLLIYTDLPRKVTFAKEP